MMNIRINNKPATILAASFNDIIGKNKAPQSAKINRDSVEIVWNQLLILISFAKGFVANIRFLPMSISDR